jgi:copper(I)-binding protein
MTWMLLSLACGSGARPELVVGQPWVRMMPPGAPNTAGFMSLTSPVDDALIGASAGISGAVELHTHAEQGGMMRMRKVDRVELPAGQLVELKAGGNHLMFIGRAERPCPCRVTADAGSWAGSSWPGSWARA